MTGDRPGTAEAAGGVPPGQRLVHGWPVSHYGPVPRFRPERWNLRVFGATASGETHEWNFDDLATLPHVTVVADLHCASGSHLHRPRVVRHPRRHRPGPGPARPRGHPRHGLGGYGFSANLRLSDFTSPRTLMAAHHNGEPLTAEHGFPLRLVVPHLYGYKSPKWLRGIEYTTADRRGFWEERGYHNIADAWQQQRYSYQEAEADGPPPATP